MDNVILDVVLGLVLIYALLAMLVMSLQEVLAGGVLKSRVTDLHALLKEATGHDDELRRRILDNPLVFSLYQGEESAKEGLLRSSGPSEIPSDVFTRALLIEVDPVDVGKPPSERFATPQNFVDDLLKKIPDKKIVRTLRALLPGREADWPGFESAIAAWFEHVGDRAKGWYKRRSARTTFLLALLLAGALNVDTFHVASALAGDPQVRSGLAKLAERVSAERERTSSDSTTATTAAANAPGPLSAEARVSARLVDAYNRLRPLYFQDAEIAAFGHRLAPVEKVCVGLVDNNSTTKGARNRQLSNNFTSDSDAWIDLLPALQTQIELLLAGSESLLPEMPKSLQQPPKPLGTEKQLRAGSDAQPSTRREPTTSAPSASQTPSAAQPAPQTPSAAQPSQQTPSAIAEPAASGASALLVAASPPASMRVADATALRLRQAHGCLTHVSAWVRAATTASKDGATQRTMLEISHALEDAKAALLQLLRERSASVSLKNLFRAAPIAFAECLRTEPTLAALRRCTEADLDATARLPIGHTIYNHLRQFCVVREKVDSRSGGLLGECNAETPEQSTVQGNLQLGTPTMTLDSTGISGQLKWLAGILTTTLFVMLGAPFWFDLLSKVVNIRAAGRRAEESETAAKGKGTLPLLQPPAAASSVAPLTPPVPTSPTFSSGEPMLTRREIIALQQRIGAVPATGEMDDKTRQKLKEEQYRLGLGSTDRITAAAYLALVGRAPLGDPAMVVGVVGRPLLRQPFSATLALATNLAQRLSLTPAQQAALVPSTVGNFSDDLRSLAVLYRYKTDAAKGRAAKVFSLANDNPGALNQIDELMLNDLLSPSGSPPQPRHPTAPWLDWAIGELGQVETGANNRKASNPRICEYLDSVSKSLGDAGDKTAWCAAFVNWVIERHLAIDVPAGGPTFSATKAAKSALAKDWATWGKRSGTTPAAGDVVVVHSTESPSGYHVGFCFEVDRASGKMYVLGGNQTGGSRVSLIDFSLGALHEARN